jgi:hypothetical protein
MNYMRTAILLAGLTGLFMAVGYLIGGGSGALIALIIAAATNLFSYWNADKLVLSMHDAQEVDERSAPELVATVRELAQRAGLPMPRVYLMDSPQPNAFATGRNPQNAAVCATTGLLNTLSRDEIAGVIGHELGHVRNHDTLTMTITATIAGAISMLAQFGMFFRGGNRDSGLGIVGSVLMLILAPLAAMIVQMAISRTVWAELLAREPTPLHRKGWHPTTVLGTIAAAAACAKLCGLDAAGTSTAMAIAASMASGLVANFGTMTKSFQVGRAAQSGVVAARLAKAGLTASLDALEHPAGLLAALSPDGKAELDRAFIAAQKEWHIVRHGLNIKRYPICYATHR